MFYEPHIVALFSGWLAALVLGGAMLWLAPRLRAVAVPNARSSHTTPTPTLGGLSFVVPMLIWLVLAPGEFALHLALTAGGLALVGLVDDLIDAPALARFAAQFVCVGWLVVHAWPELSGPWQAILTIAVVWFVNLCNFMDGIDGIMGAQAVVFALGAILLTGAPMSWHTQTLWLLAGGAIGFLTWNWPPARFFMGDVGSLFLGLVLAAFAVEMALEGMLPAAASVVLLSVFWFDTTFTLCMRILTRQRFLAAHKSHMYQRVAQKKGHLWTTTAYLVYAAVYLLPLAWISVRYPSMEIPAIMLAVAPLAVVALKLGAGRADVNAVTNEFHG